MRPNSGKNSVNRFRFDSSRCLPRVAGMEQVDPKIRAIYVAARRASDAGIVKVQEIGGRMAGTGTEQVSDKSSYNWSRDEPDLPEKMIDAGEMTRDDFPTWTRPGINKH